MAKGKKFNLTSTLMSYGGVCAGVGAAKALDMVPQIAEQDQMLVNGGKVVAGALIPVFVKNDMVKAVGMGMVAEGFSKLADMVISAAPSASGVGSQTAAYIDYGNMGLKGTN